MSQLPRGTITLLFSDIEGSALLLQQLGERYASVLSSTANCYARLEASFTVTRSIPVGMVSSSFSFAPERLSWQQWRPSVLLPRIPGPEVW